MENKTKTIRDVFTIRETKTGEHRWVKIGVAFDNKDGSVNILLDALPINGELQIRDRKEKTQSE